ncbi:hypothetical protein E2562_021398 [Oryza meyeriana var. granulata]|uniref:Uncharacterized protein n=1 Tax=Oryza meyeriana var. granulata TaxID=110450 RepID=A0A6G1EXJ6_9ORYZ|nr:hypothetical protein E2562_021398 [Oryza meyeriana var. granulata]
MTAGLSCQDGAAAATRWRGRSRLAGVAGSAGRLWAAFFGWAGPPRPYWLDRGPAWPDGFRPLRLDRPAGRTTSEGAAWLVGAGDGEGLYGLF